MEEKQIKKVLLTGGLGYIGSHTAVELLNKGFEVFILDNLSNSDIRTLDRIKKITGKKPHFEKIDLCDYKKLGKFFKKNKDIDNIIHLAGYKYVKESVDDPQKYYFNNLVSLLNILDIVKKYNVRDFVFSSSCTVYGELSNMPVDEKTVPGELQSPYAQSKKMSEDIIEDFSINNKEISFTILRYFNAGGAHNSGLLGEQELSLGRPHHLIPSMIDSILKSKKFKIFGSDYKTSDGTCVRDYLHVSDIADAHVLALDKKDKNKNLRKYNLGTGRGMSILEIINAFHEYTDQKVEYEIYPRRSGDAAAAYADYNLALNELNWRPKRHLGEILRSAWSWESSQNNKK